MNLPSRSTQIFLSWFHTREMPTPFWQMGPIRENESPESIESDFLSWFQSLGRCRHRFDKWVRLGRMHLPSSSNQIFYCPDFTLGRCWHRFDNWVWLGRMNLPSRSYQIFLSWFQVISREIEIRTYRSDLMNSGDAFSLIGPICQSGVGISREIEIRTKSLIQSTREIHSL